MLKIHEKAREVFENTPRVQLLAGIRFCYHEVSGEIMLEKHIILWSGLYFYYF